MKRTAIRKVSPKRKSRVGKLGIVRLVGDDLEALRQECFERDRWICQECHCWVYDFADDEMNAFRPRAEMAHIRTKRNNGDSIDNVRTLCPDCHRLEHAGGKPVPPK